MTKQEEIREGVEKFVSEAYWYEGKKNVVESITNELLQYLHSQGVVLKVKRDLPECPYIKTRYPERKAWGWSRNALLDAGYVAVIPLIEDIKSEQRG